MRVFAAWTPVITSYPTQPTDTANCPEHTHRGPATHPPEVVQAHVVQEAGDHQHVAVPQLDLRLRHVLALQMREQKCKCGWGT